MSNFQLFKLLYQGLSDVQPCPVSLVWRVRSGCGAVTRLKKVRTSVWWCTRQGARLASEARFSPNHRFSAPYSERSVIEDTGYWIFLYAIFDNMAATSEPKRMCIGADCPNEAGTLQCPTCLKLGMKESFFCSQDCFKNNWVRILLNSLAVQLADEAVHDQN